MELNDVLITGANGMVGSYIDFGTRLGRQELDITDALAVEKMFEEKKPRAVIHLAAETDVDRCEREPAHAYLVNSAGTYNVARAAKKIGAKVIYISTVYVFDGSKGAPYDENDIPSPLTYYGHSKNLGEIAIKELLGDYIIFRPCWMFGGGPEKDKKFVMKIMKQLGQDEIKGVNDVTGSLTYAKDMVAKIKELLAASKGKEKKIVHVANAGFASRYDIAAEMVRIIKSPTKVTPVDSAYFNLAASRSSSDRVVSVNGGIMRPWQEALADYLQNEWTGQAK